MKNKKLSRLIICLSTFSLLLSACGSQEETDSAESESGKETIVIGISADVTETMNVITPLIESAGYEVEVEVFDDWTAPNTALSEGSIDANFFQHEPFMEIYNEEYGEDLVMLEPHLEYGIWGLYSEKFDSLDSIADGASCGVASDPSNRDRSLQILNEGGVITLADEPLDEYYDVVDIVENPHNINFELVEYNSMVSVMDDVDMVVLSAVQYYENGGDPTTVLCHDDKTEYALGLVVRSEDQDSQWAQDMIKAVATEEFKENLNEVYPSCYGYAF